MQPSHLCCCRFLVLVAGTMVYGRGDEQGTKEELADAVAEALSAGPAVEEQAPLLPPAAAAIPVQAVATPSEPIVVRGSFKSTMTMVSGSYSRSFTRGSLPRGSFSQTLYNAPSRDSDPQV